MTFMQTECALAMSTLLHALPASTPDSPILGMPAAVFGAVVSGLLASAITLAGVFVSNWHNRQLKRSELDHDATQRNREREMALRRDVFLPAVEAALTMQYSLGALVNFQLPVTGISEKYAMAHATFIKVAAVGTQDTVNASQTLASALGKGFWELSLRRGGLENLQSQLADLDRNTTIHEGLRDAWIKVQLDLVTKAEKDNDAWQAARNHVTHHVNEIGKAMAERNRVVGLRQSAQGEMASIMLTHMETLGALFPPALFAMRREMQLPLDETAFLERYGKLREEQMAMLRATIGPAQGHVADTEATK